MGDAALLLPLTMLDESLLFLQETRAAWNVQFEVAADHRVDADRLRQAVRSCCQRHPTARARLATADTGGNYARWDIADDVDRDPYGWWTARTPPCWTRYVLSSIRRL
jgi:hypothetical protein